MPSNCISINGREEYIVSDSKMDNLIGWLEANGYTYSGSIPYSPSLSCNCLYFPHFSILQRLFDYMKHQLARS